MEVVGLQLLVIELPAKYEDSIVRTQAARGRARGTRCCDVRFLEYCGASVEMVKRQYENLPNLNYFLLFQMSFCTKVFSARSFLLLSL